MARALWQEDTVRWFRRAVHATRFPELVRETIAPLLREGDSILDVGCGPGTLSIPLAQRGHAVTALESSEAMIAGLHEEIASAGVGTVTPLHADWFAVHATLPAHDVLLAANVAPVVRDLDGFLPAAHAIARRWVIVILGAGPRENKFFLRELRDLLGLPQSPARKDYLEQYTGLHARGIFANVRIVEYDFGQPFDDWADAVAFHRAHLGLETTEHDAAIETFLRDHLEATAAGLRSPMLKRSAILWWAPPGAA